MSISRTETYEKTVSKKAKARITWTTFLGTDTLLSPPTVTVVKGDVTVSNVLTAANVTTFLISGGTAGTHTIVVRALSSDGRDEPVYCTVKVSSEPS